MTALALAAALATLPLASAPQGPAPWRLVSRPGLHVGARPAFFLDNEANGALEWGLGASLQVTR